MIEKLRVAVVQLNPRIGHVTSNMDRATRLLVDHNILAPSKDTPGSQPVDLVVLPELAFTGYNFKTPSAIEQYLEPTAAGVSTQWASKLSRTLGCSTLVGYPEKCVETSKTYNAASMSAPDGTVAFNYRKTFLYSADEEWGASESPDGFVSYRIDKLSNHNPKLSGLKVQVGICMDLNPYKFEAPFEAYEFANAAVKNDPSLILCPMAWLHPNSPNLEEDATKRSAKKLELEYELDPSETQASTVNYWMMRMMPFISPPGPSKKISMVSCNRSGWEDDVLYAGSSSLFTFDPSRGAHRHFLDYHGSLGTLEENVLYHEVEIEVD